MNDREPDDFQPRAQIKKMFQEGKLKPGDDDAFTEFSEKYIVAEKLVLSYVQHLTEIEKRKQKRQTENNRTRLLRQQQQYNDIDWSDLFHNDELSSLRVNELNLYISHHNIQFKGKKREKVNVVKAHIGSHILSSMVQESQDDTEQPTSDSSDADSDADQVDRVVGSSSSSDSDTEQEVQVAEETPQSSTSRYGRKRMRVMNESFVSWQNIEM